MSDLLQLALFAAVFLVIFLLITRAMKQRDARWEGDDWRQRDRGSVKVGSALLEIHSMFEPDRKHQVEETRRAHLEEEESGAPPKANGDEPDTDADEQGVAAVPEGPQGHGRPG